MGHVSVKRFGELRLAWARAQFAQELRTDFQRARMFDSPLTVEVLSALLRQPREKLRILAEVLPLDVFSEAPPMLERRSRLPDEARTAVEAFRSDYDRVYQEHLYDHVKFISRSDDQEVQRDFRAAARTGNRMVMEIADRWKCGVDGGAPGEWGLIFKRDWGRLTVSLSLSRQMTVAYSVTFFDPAFNRVRLHDDFLIALGICAGSWIVEGLENFPAKFSQASDFARWHLYEYERIIEKIQSEEEPFVTNGGT
jgi:hypothetical protein